MTTKRLSILFLFIFFLAGSAYTQQSNSLFFMHRIPQSNFINPAVQIDCPFYVGLPLLSSLHLNFNSTGFSYNDIAGGASVNFSSLVSQMHSWDYLSGEFHYTPVSFGFMYDNERYFSFSWTERVESKMLVSKNLMSLFADGNTQYVGGGLSTANPGLNGFYYREFSFGYSQQLQNEMLVGLHAKVLFGLAGVFTRRNPVNIEVDALTYNIDASWNPQIDAAYPLSVTTDAAGNVTGVTAGQFSPLPFFLNFNNLGLAFDLGFVKPGDPITWSGSVLDLGFIWWLKNTNRFENDGHFVYRGATPADLANPDDYVAMLADSINNQIQFSHAPSSFVTFLNPKAYFGATYNLSQNLLAGAHLRAEWYPGRPVVGLTLSAIALANKGSSLALTYSVMNGSLRNVGAAFNLGGKRFQFYMLSDNILAAFYPEKARNANLRFGFNLFFGCTNKSRKPNAPPSMSGNCYWTWSLEQKRRKIK
ncbi:MAG: hypothetical protein PWR03_993 [Tenuifilum sp.]|jgi:hypothetical protein|uniref:DUF5723 family protein n=1 Tax=Tenuifilum sp. TaxID=2760880 RepID=UPI0024AB86EA|nr:DUF5723 family protein [Tenuifilum sp.]MDI3526810.1 hypothetical protein [Tenuifilum sp.]